MKNSLWLFVGILVLFTLSACTAVAPEPPATVNNFKECIAAGNPAMESYPRQCRHGDRTFTEVLEPVPGDEKPCTREYQPVCGEIQVQCIKAPCPPVKTTYPNRCMAENAGAESIEEGACEEEGPDLRGTCEEVDGKWLPDSNECEGVSRETCETVGGTYNECASACRNDPEAEICTMQCIQVCQF